MKIYNAYDFYQSELHLLPEYKELNGYLNTMDLKGVETWFMTKNVRNNADLMGRMYEHLIRKSIVGYDKTPDSDEDVKARDLTVLPHFSFQTQIRLLEHCMPHRFDGDYLKILNFNDGFLAQMMHESDYFIANNIEAQSFCTLVHTLFHHDDFSSLNILIEHCPEGLVTRLMELTQHHFTFYIDYDFPKNSFERYYITLSEHSFQIKDDLVFSYSQNKMHWLEAHDVSLPTIEHVHKLSSLIFQAIYQDDFFKYMHGVQLHGMNFDETHLGSLQQAFNGYKARMLYHKLSDQIEGHTDIPTPEETSQTSLNGKLKI
jgi:hypothetical protein